MPSEPTVAEVRELLTRAELCLNDGVSWAGPSIEIVAALCRHFLASQQPMTAGEFAGLVGKRLKHKRSLAAMKGDWERARVWNKADGEVSELAREHNITVVEPTK